MISSTPNAGGRATETGMSFEALVGTWFAAHLVTDMPVGQRFGLAVEARPTELQFETGDALDDIVVRLSDGGAIHVQCKTRPSLQTTSNSQLAAVVRQLVNFYLAARRSGQSPPDPTRVAAVLAIAEDAPRSLDDLENGCRAFDTGGQWPEALQRINDGQRRALEIFAKHAEAAWASQTGTAAGSAELVDLARLFHISRFGENDASTDWFSASNLVGNRLFGREEAGRAATATLGQVVRQLIRSGAPADRLGLLRALRSAGHIDTRSPNYDADIRAIKDYTDAEYARLIRHSTLPIGAGVPLNRECLGSLDAAVQSGSLLVTGEPGAGKTGVLVALVEKLVRQATPFVFLSVDRLAGVSNVSDFDRELRIGHPLLDVLACPSSEFLRQRAG